MLAVIWNYVVYVRMWLNKICEEEKCLLNVFNEKRRGYLSSLESLKSWETFV